MDSQTGDGPPRAVLIAALVVAVGGLVGVLAVAALNQRTPGQEPVAVTAAPAPQADSPQCRALLDGLPEQLGDFRRAPLVDPAPPGAAAWQRVDGGEALILRCGLDRPAEFTVGAPLQVVDAVQWFRVEDPAGGDRSTWFAVDRAVYVALTLPPESGPTPIQGLSATLADTLPARPPDPAPLG
ncbi:hypothetical protein FHR72_002959 [Mycolicibacterium iranicum]|uniref:DUF3515 domain-containing protein n=1 Tax=Mycolicibacterium iranicum TaxID=912594 RepID=A0A839Q9G0_MYCIR|nr:DUF3515 domain-containing protein [Mycolicibacterium iranicum]MBB2991474.1 hypothetical protein [Mycolicibacterium iranicum]